MQTLEQQLQKLRTMEQAVAQYKPNIDELENINKVRIVFNLFFILRLLGVDIY